MSSPSPSMTLTLKENYYLSKNKFGEIINPNCLIELIKSDYLNEMFNKNNYSEKIASKQYKNEKEQLNCFMKIFDKKKSIFPVTYTFCSKHTLGRLYNFKSLGITSFRKKIRNTLIHQNYIDLDLSNAQPTILYNICKGKISIPFLEKLIMKREEVLKNVMETYNVDRTLAKKLFLRLSFYGTFEGWKLENKLKDIEETEYILGLTNELYTISNEIIKNNKELFLKVKKLKENEKKENLNGSFMAFYLQTYELQIIDAVIQYICEETDLCNILDLDYKILTYEYDGIKLLKEGVIKYGLENLINDLENVILTKTGFHMKIEEKPIEKIYDLEYEPYEKIIDDEEDINNFDGLTTYEEIKEKFEKSHCKILYPINYVKKNEKEFDYFNEKNLIQTYRHLTFENNVYDKKGNLLIIKEESFIEKWIKDKTIKKYDRLNFYPNENDCPFNELNVWVKFDMDFIDNYKEDKEAIKLFRHHILVLCGNDKKVFEYFECWLAQLIQYPTIKSICPVLISQEGAGKGTLLSLIKKMIGINKFLSSCDPKNEIFGKFNSLMLNAYVVELNEISKNDIQGSKGKFKHYITEPTIQIEKKGHDPIVINSFQRFIITTNSDDPITTKKDDRRNLIIRSSDELIGNKQYFKDINEKINNVDAVKSYYEYLKKLDVKNFNDLPIPKTEYQENLKEQNEDIIDTWLKSFACFNYDEKEVKTFTSKELFVFFNSWREMNGIKYELNAIQLGVKIANKKINGIEKGTHTQKGNTKNINFQKLKLHYNIT